MAVRLSVKVSDATYETLQDLAKRDEISMTDVLRRALWVYKVLDKESRGGAHDVVVRSTDGEVRIPIAS